MTRPPPSKKTAKARSCEGSAAAAKAAAVISQDLEGALGRRFEGPSDLRNLDLNLFRVFEAVYSCSTLTEAANRLGISQPAVSVALGRLRDFIGEDLFVRQGRNLCPTPLARTLIHPVRDALGRIQLALSERSQFDPATSKRKFRLSMSDRLEYELLPGLMSRLQRLAPQVRVRNRLLPSSESSEALSSGLIDFAVDPPGASRQPQLVHVPLVNEEMVCALRPGHPMLPLGEDFSVRDYVSLSHVLVSNREDGRDLADFALDRLNKQRPIGLVCQHRLAVPWVLRATDMAYSCERSFAEHHQLGFLPMPFPAEQTCLHLYWHASQDSDAGNTWLRTQLLEVAGSAFPSGAAPESRALFAE